MLVTAREEEEVRRGNVYINVVLIGTIDELRNYTALNNHTFSTAFLQRIRRHTVYMHIIHIILTKIFDNNVKENRLLE